MLKLNLNKVLFYSLLMFIGLSFASVSAEDVDHEISYLLEFIRTSDCTFIRNGNEHNSKKAAKYIEKKYKHYKNKIKTTEDFVDLCATRPSKSNEPYEVSLEGKAKIKSRDWLLDELKKLRRN